MSIRSISSALVWIKVIQWCGKKGSVILTVPVEELYWSSNRMEKVFSQMGHGRFVDGSTNFEFLLEFCQLKEQFFGLIGHKRSEVWNVINDVIDRIFEHLS